VWVGKTLLALFQVGRAASCRVHVMGMLFSLTACVSSPAISVLGWGRKSISMVDI